MVLKMDHILNRKMLIFDLSTDKFKLITLWNKNDNCIVCGKNGYKFDI